MWVGDPASHSHLWTGGLAVQSASGKSGLQSLEERGWSVRPRACFTERRPGLLVGPAGFRASRGLCCSPLTPGLRRAGSCRLWLPPGPLQVHSPLVRSVASCRGQGWLFPGLPHQAYARPRPPGPPQALDREDCPRRPMQRQSWATSLATPLPSHWLQAPPRSLGPG